MYKYLARFLTLLFVCLCSLEDANSAAMSKELWGGLKAEDLRVLKQLAVEIKRDNLDQALYLARSMKNYDSEFSDAAIDIVLWHKYSKANIDAKKTSFSDISRFINDNKFFPGKNDLRRNLEKVAVQNNVPYKSSLYYFGSNSPGTVASKMYLIKSKSNYLSTVQNVEEKERLIDDIQKSISNLWVYGDFDDDEKKEFLDLYADKITEIDNIKRVDRLLWDLKFTEANKLIPKIDEDYQKLFNAIIELARYPKDADQVVLSVPRRLRGNEGLYYRRVLYHKMKGQEDEIIDLLAKIPAKTDHSDKWWSLRKLYGRELLKKKKYKLSYDIFLNHGLDSGSVDYAEAEWTSGWIALRFLDEPKIAHRHFKNVYFNVSYPISISRGAYWMGMAYQEMGDIDKAIEWYKIAAKYPTYFYGQLAIHKHKTLDSVGASSDIILPADPDISSSDIKFVSNMLSVKVAYLLAVMGDKSNATKVIENAIDSTEDEGQVAVIMKLVNEVGDMEFDFKVSKIAARKNVFFIKDKFQILNQIKNDSHAPLVHAIIKQESGFATSALSSVGAVGFMQLMPDTAKFVARQLGVSYSKYKLSRDVNYNIKLGSYYIKSLIDKFDGSEILAIASYNAGPNAAQRWIDEFYDPRKEEDIDKVVDWIELITYAETRNYVQRIMENLIVYKYLMSRSNYDELK